MGREYPNPLGTEMGFNFSSPLGMRRVTGKYMGVEDEDREGKTRPHPVLFSCLPSPTSYPPNKPVNTIKFKEEHTHSCHRNAQPVPTLLQRHIVFIQHKFISFIDQLRDCKVILSPVTFISKKYFFRYIE